MFQTPRCCLHHPAIVWHKICPTRKVPFSHTSTFCTASSRSISAVPHPLQNRFPTSLQYSIHPISAMHLTLPVRAHTWPSPISPSLEKGFPRSPHGSQPGRHTTASPSLLRRRPVFLLLAVLACTFITLYMATKPWSSTTRNRHAFPRIPWDDVRGVGSQGLREFGKEFSDDKLYPGPEADYLQIRNAG